MLRPLRREIHLHQDLVEQDLQLARRGRHRRPHRLLGRVGPAHSVAEPSVVEGAGSVDDAAVGAGGGGHALLAAHAEAVAVAAVTGITRHTNVDNLHGVGVGPESE